MAINLFQSNRGPQLSADSQFGKIGDTLFSKNYKATGSGQLKNPNPTKQEFANLALDDTFASDLATFGAGTGVKRFADLDAEGFRNLPGRDRRRLFNLRMQGPDFFSDAPLQQTAGLTGEGGRFTEEDIDPFATFLAETPNTLEGELVIDADGFAVLNDDKGGTIKLNLSQVEHFEELADKYGNEKATIITRLEEEALADQVALDEKFTEDDLEVLWDRSITVDEKLTTLDDLYGQDDIGLVRAGKDWEEFLDSSVDPEDSSGVSWRDFFESSGQTLPEITSNGFGLGDTDDETMDKLLDNFMGWKVDKNAVVAANAAGAPTDIDPGDGAEAPDITDENFLSDMFGTGDADQIMQAILEGVRTTEEIQSDFEATRESINTNRELFTKPEERAVARENAGFLGGGVKGQLARNQVAFDAEESTARANFESAARMTNLASVQQAVEVAKTPAQVAKAYSEIGINLAQTDMIRAQTDTLDTDMWIKEVMLPHQIESINIVNRAAQNTDYSTMLRNASAIHGIDSAFLVDQANMYNQQYSGIFADPMMGVYMSLLNMNMFENIASTSGGGGGKMLGTIAGSFLGGPAGTAIGAPIGKWLEGLFK